MVFPKFGNLSNMGTCYNNSHLLKMNIMTARFQDFLNKLFPFLRLLQLYQNTEFYCAYYSMFVYFIFAKCIWRRVEISQNMLNLTAFLRLSKV